MSAPDFSTDFNSATSNNYNVVILVILVIIGVIYCYSAKKMRKAIPVIASEMRATIVPQSEDYVWEPDAQTLEKFFMELAQDYPVRFTAEQLCSFTQNYSTLLGSGGFGKVYKGQLPNGVKIAVKVLHRGPHKNIEEQFVAEVGRKIFGTIARTRHINLVKLFGFCFDEFKSTLVYEYIENQSLDKHLFSKTKNLAWEKLNEIAVGAAKGIAYVHEEYQGRLIHYDINPGNVLLDVDFSPKVADFGVAKLCKRDIERVFLTGRRDTRVYFAPELVYMNHPISHKCDVYSFGILLFEIAGRRKNKKAWDDWFPKQVWEEYEKGELMTLIAVCGIEEKYRATAERMFMVALWCVQDSPETRPSMSDIVKMLEGSVEIESPPRPFQELFRSG